VRASELISTVKGWRPTVGAPDDRRPFVATLFALNDASFHDIHRRFAEEELWL
jgi:hypothetical protein